jgi:hypothetical protein
LGAEGEDDESDAEAGVELVGGRSIGAEVGMEVCWEGMEPSGSTS